MIRSESPARSPASSAYLSACGPSFARGGEGVVAVLGGEDLDLARNGFDALLGHFAAKLFANRFDRFADRGRGHTCLGVGGETGRR